LSKIADAFAPKCSQNERNNLYINWFLVW